MKVIELCGKAGVGKDTFCVELIKQLEAKGEKCIHIAFADYLKFICKQYFSWNGDKDEKGRELLQYIGTDVFRKQDENFWVNIVANFLTVCSNENIFDYAIITDARFPNEINCLSAKLNAVPFRIKRNNYVSKLSESAQKHSSETALDNFKMDEIILSGEKRNLPQEVKEFIDNWKI